MGVTWGEAGRSPEDLWGWECDRGPQLGLLEFRREWGRGLLL